MPLAKAPTDLRGVVDAAIKSLGMSQRQAAEKLGLDLSNLGKQINGHAKVSGPVTAAVTAWLEIDRLESEPSTEGVDSIRP